MTDIFLYFYFYVNYFLDDLFKYNSYYWNLLKYLTGIKEFFFIEHKRRKKKQPCEIIKSAL